MAIINILPVKNEADQWIRSQQKIIFDNKPSVIRCRGPHNPVWYVNELDEIYSSDITHIEEKTNAVTSQLRNKNHVSVGISKEGDPSKFIGFRPDKTQVLGTEQLEFSIEEIEVDGSNVNVKMNKFDQLDSITTDLGNIVIRSARQFTKVMAEISPYFSFKLSFTLHITPGTFKIANELIGDYYTPNENNEFIITDLDDNFKFRLASPKLLDEDFNVLHGRATKHSLRYINGKDFQYIKESITGCDFTDVAYVDGDIYYAETSDGCIGEVYFGWTNCRNAATGNQGPLIDVASYDTAASAANSSSVCTIWRSFFMFDLSGCGGATAVDLNIYGVTNNDSDVMAQEGTQGNSLTLVDYDAFTGSSFGYVAWSTGGYNTITFNAGGISYINGQAGGTAYICCREKSHDYDNSDPGSPNAYDNGCYYANYTGTDHDPYLDIIQSITRQQIIMVF